MKIFLACVSMLLVCGRICAQQPHMWPIERAKVGEGIIYAPQSYIDGELNFAGLYITAPEGTAVVAPTGGTIRSLTVSYNPTLSTSQSWRIDEGNSIDRQRETIIGSGQLDNAIDSRYLCGEVGLLADDGCTIWIGGLASEHVFKTGQRIERGEVLGRVAHSYCKIAEPSIELSVDKGGRPADPMTPFGLRTTFVAPDEIKPVVSLTREQATEDFTIYVDALRECFVGLHNVISPEEFDAFTRRTLADIAAHPGDIPYADFRAIIERSTARIHDSHISLYPAQWRVERPGGPSKAPGVWFGFFSDTLRVSNAIAEHRELVGHRIAAINGIAADSIRRIILAEIGSYDAATESYKAYALATPRGFPIFLLEPWVGDDCNLLLTLADGSMVDIPGVDRPQYVHSMATFPNLNRHRAGFATRMQTDSVAYLGLGTFGLNQVQVESIGAFIDSISRARVPNLVVDVRNNGGGTSEVISRLYSYIAGREMTLHGFSRVGSNGRYTSFAHSLNQIADSEPFADYLPSDEGFVKRSTEGIVVRADSLINYRGRIFMLTNENSVSAATLFPAMLVRNHRGVTVGRETRGAYHFMNAVKFVEVRLPTSLIVVRLPLIETHFDTVVNERVPYGRGVMPDYPMPLSLAEMTSEGDAMLDYTLGLIDRSEYLRGDDPFTGAEADGSRSGFSLPFWAWMAIGVGAVVAGVLARLFFRGVQRGSPLWLIGAFSASRREAARKIP